MEVKDKIVAKSGELFMRYGIKSITMDEVALHCNISKKTIYQFFPDKDALVKEVMIVHMQEDLCHMEDIYNQECSALEEVLKISEYMKKDMAEIHPSVLFDLKKYHSSAFEIFESHRDKHFMQSVVRNLEKGIGEGVYRPEIDIQLMARLRVLEVESMFSSDLVRDSKNDLAYVQLQFIDHFVRGVVTEAGLQEWTRISAHLMPKTL